MNASKWREKAIKHAEQREFAEAEEAFRRAIDLDPHHAYAWFNLGFLLRNQDKHAFETFI